MGNTISKRRQKLLDTAISTCIAATATPADRKLHDKAVGAIFAVLGDGIHNDDKPEFLEMIQDRSKIPLSWKMSEYGDWKLTIAGVVHWYRL